MQLYKESSTESQKVSPKPEIFRTTKSMRSDKVLFPKSQPNSWAYDTVKAYTAITDIKKYVSTNGCIRLTAYKTEVSLEETAPICTCHLDHCSCWNPR